MKSITKKKEEILAIDDPRKAYIRLATDEELPLDEVEQILQEYMERHNVSLDEMAYYPNGERVLTLEMFQ